ncbi:hypothetical protein [Streptacidiphilus sp. PAMC 29251]
MSGAARLRDVGHACGAAFLQAENVLALTGEATRLGMSWKTLVAGGLATVADDTGGKEALTEATAACRREHDRALRALRDVPNPAAVRLASGVMAAIAAPATSPGAPASPETSNEFHAV